MTISKKKKPAAATGMPKIAANDRAPAGPLPLSLLKEIQTRIAAVSVRVPGYAHPNEWASYVWVQDGAFRYNLVEGTNNSGAAMLVPPGSIAQVHSHPPGFGYALDGMDSTYLNRASSSLSPTYPGDVQRWVALNGIWRAYKIQWAYVFGPTQVNCYDLSKLTGVQADIMAFTTVLSGADVRWPLHEASQIPMV